MKSFRHTNYVGIHPGVYKLRPNAWYESYHGYYPGDLIQVTDIVPCTLGGRYPCPQCPGAIRTPRGDLCLSWSGENGTNREAYLEYVGPL